MPVQLMEAGKSASFVARHRLAIRLTRIRRKKLERRSPHRDAGLWAAPLGAGGFGETADRLGFVVVDVEDRIEFSNLQQVMNLLRKV